MKLKECFVENFGKLHHYKMEFTDGLNTLLRENGFGKTTLAAFIEALFYGLDSGRGKESDRKKYTPWQGGRYGGSVIFSVGDKNYRLERFFEKKEKDDSFMLYNEDTGLISKDYSENIGLELFGIDKDSYEKSAFIPQGKVEADLSKAGDINAKLSDLLESENDLASFEDAITIIKDAKNKFKRTGGIIKNLENQISSSEETIKRTEELIKVQNELKNYIAEKRYTKKDVQSNIEKAHSHLQKKEKIAFYESLKKDIEKSQERLESLKTATKKIPEDNKLLEIKEKTEAYKNISAIYDSKRLTAEEEENLDKLNEELGGKAVSLSEADKVKELFSKYHSAKELVSSAGLKDIEKEKLSSLKAIFDNEAPEEELSEIYYEIRTVNDGAKNKQIVPLLIGIFLVLAGIFVLFLNKAIYSVALFVLGVIFLVLSLLNKVKSKRKAKEAGIRARSFFEKYAVLYSGDIKASARELKEKIEEYSFLINKRKQLETYKENTELSLIENMIEEKSLFLLGKYEGVETAEKEINNFIKNSELLYSIISKKEEYEKVEEELKRAYENLKILTFEYTDKAPETAYEYLSSVKVQKDREEEILEDKRSKLKEFILKNGILEMANEEAISETQIEVLKERLEELDEEIISSEKRLMDMITQTELLPELISENENLEEELSLAKKKLFITEKAEEALNKAKENLAIKYLGPLSENFENYKKLLIVPGDAKLDTELKVGVIEAGEKHSSESYSAGIRDVLALALRFSLIESLFEKEKPIVILDDPFVNLDEQRIAEARKALNVLSEKYQILYFVCHESRK